MEIYREPADYQALGGEVIYGITGTDIDQTVEIDIRIGEDHKTVGIKRFYGADNYLINVGGYLRGAVRVEPFWRGECGVSAATGRTVAAGISVGNITTPDTVLTVGSKDAALFRRLSDAPRQTAIAAGEWDELAWIAPGSETLVEIRFKAIVGANMEIALESVLCVEGMSVLLLEMDDLAERIAATERVLSDFRTMEVCVVCDGETAFAQQYVLQHARPAGVRLCWVNEYGAIDYYTFHSCIEERLAVTKTRMNGVQGHEVLASESETQLVLMSEYESHDTMRWLAGIAAAPKVWRVLNNTAENGASKAMETRFEAVDMVTDQVVIHKTGTLSRLEITIRPAQKTKYQ